MNAHVAPPQIDVPESLDAVVARQRRMLAELAEIGMDIARSMRREAAARAEAAEAAAEASVGRGEPAPAAGPDLSLAMTRLTRAVRLTLAMEKRLAEEQAGLVQARAARQASERGLEGLRRYGRKLTVEAAIKQQIEVEAPEREVERLYEDLIDRIEGEAERDEDFLERPISEVIGFICKDMGLTPDWSLWEEEDWAIAEAEERAMRSPYAAMARQQAREERALWGRGDDPPKWPP